MLWRELAKYFPESIQDSIRDDAKQLVEIRLRANQQTQLVYMDDEDVFVGEVIDIDRLWRIALAMMEYSYHSYEHELTRGYFTMKNGCRVGVGGSFVILDDGKHHMKAINSLCVRIPRDKKGCAEELVSEIMDGGMKNTLILSAPGRGKTTMLRDTARILSENGYKVGIADERHEIAACIDGEASYDLGPRCDIIDGYPKDKAIGILIRSLSPQVIITDEIGGIRDGYAIREAARMGVTVVASAHASSVEDFEKSRMGVLLREGIFRLTVILGTPPGKICGLRRFAEG